MGDSLDPVAFEWSSCFDEDNLEPDMSCQDPLSMVHASTKLDTLNPSVVSVQGRLKKHKDFWLNELEPSSFVAGIITEGYRLPFLRLPDPLFQLNHRSALVNASFVSGAIDELVLGRCVVECTSCPTVCSPLSVVTNASGKQRLVLDLRYVNQFLPERKFKYEGLELIPTLFESGDFFTTFDLKSGYHHVDLHEDSWPYLGFSWGSGTARKWFTFRVLPFGLSTACYVFTKLLRPLVKRWRSKGLRCIVYIDDGIYAAKSRDRCVEGTGMIVDDLTLAGFILNIPKSKLTPQQIGQWLGFILDLLSGKFFVPKEKMSKLWHAIDKVLASRLVPARLLASVVGQIISMSLAIGPVARLRTRALYDVINTRSFWSEKLSLSSLARDELLFWKSSMQAFNGRPIWFSAGATRVVFSDASSTGYGGFHNVVEVGPDIAHGQWSQYEASLSSTWRELKAVSVVLNSFAPKLSGHRVKWFTDNQNVVRIVESGSKKQHLQVIALSVFKTCLQQGIRLDMEWIPRSLNDKADYISRIQDFDDWSVNPQFFSWIDSMWGPHSVDCFAHVDNTQLPKFYSRFWCPGATAVDAFTVNWSGDVNWWVPPISLIGRVLRHAKACDAMGTLVVPVWKSAPFWPLLCPDGSHLAFFVHQWVCTPFQPSLFIPGRSGNNIGEALTPESVVLCLWLDFTVPPRDHLSGFCLRDCTGACALCVANSD